jgi:hypothetical protein
MSTLHPCGDIHLTINSFSAPEALDTVLYSRVQVAETSPFATFTFYYRSTAALKSLGIIARTPSPSPEPEPEPKAEMR